MNDRLSLERQKLISAWYRYVSREQAPQPVETTVDQEVAASWARSALTVSPERACAPIMKESDVQHVWHESPWSTACAA